MKKYKFVIKIIAILFLLVPVALYGQKDEKVAKQNAKTFIKATSSIVTEANRVYLKNKTSVKGYLARSVAHQHYAIKMFNDGNYGKAVVHSWKSRKQAVIVLKMNQYKIRDEWYVSHKDVCPPLNPKLAKKVKDKKINDLGPLETELDADVDGDEDDDNVDMKFDALK